MYLARREAGKVLRVYQVRTLEREPRAWAFHCTGADGKGCSTAAMAAGCFPGVAATGYTRSDAISNLQLIEEHAPHA